MSAASRPPRLSPHKAPEQARLVGSTIFGLQNSLKVYYGRREALADKAILAKKQAEEEDFRAKVDANPEWKKEYGDAWDTIAHGEEAYLPEFKGQFFRRTDSQLFGFALSIVQYVAEIKKPDGERLPQFYDAGLESLLFRLKSPAPDLRLHREALHEGRPQDGPGKTRQQRSLHPGDSAGPTGGFHRRCPD